MHADAILARLFLRIGDMYTERRNGYTGHKNEEMEPSGELHVDKPVDS